MLVMLSDIPEPKASFIKSRIASEPVIIFRRRKHVITTL